MFTLQFQGRGGDDVIYSRPEDIPTAKRQWHLLLADFSVLFFFSFSPLLFCPISVCLTPGWPKRRSWFAPSRLLTWRTRRRWWPASAALLWVVCKTPTFFFFPILEWFLTFYYLMLVLSQYIIGIYLLQAFIFFYDQEKLLNYWHSFL